MTVALLIVASFLTAYCRVCYKIAMRTTDEVEVVIAAQTVSALAASPLLVFFFPSQAFDIYLLILQASLWGAFVYFEIRSLRHLDLGLAAILGSAEYLVQITIGLFLFHENVTGFKLLGCLLLTIGLITSANWRMPNVQKGMLYQLLAVSCAVAVFPVDALLVKQISPWFVGAVAFLGVSLLLLVWRKRERHRVFALIKSSTTVRLAGLSNLAGYCLILFLLTQWNFIDTVSSFQLVTCFSLLLGYFVLHERDYPKRRLLACLLIILGVGCFRA